MYMPNPEQALREMRRVLLPGGRVSLAVWGERSKCGWSSVFPIVDAEVASEVCPLFFRLGQKDTLARLCADAEFEAVEHRRISTTLDFADVNEACNAAFVGGPVALAWSRFSDEVRARVRQVATRQWLQNSRRICHHGGGCTEGVSSLVDIDGGE
jgi:SAM-dependent methyltransferase